MELTLQPSTLQQAVETVCQLMMVSAITAPKAKGENFVQVKAVCGEQVQALAEAMRAFGAAHNKAAGFNRDGGNVAGSEAVVLVGLKAPKTCGLNCGACGFELCDELIAAQPTDGEFRGPVCAMRLIDLGIALGSAVKTAGMLNVDNRIMYRIGAAARAAGLVDWEVVLGVPLSITGKSIYFDR